MLVAVARWSFQAELGPLTYCIKRSAQEEKKVERNGLKDFNQPSKEVDLKPASDEVTRDEKTNKVHDAKRSA